MELHFAGGELDGLKLIGFAVWALRDGAGKIVAFPARQFTVHGEGRHYSPVRCVDDVQAEKRLKDVVLAYLANEAGSADGTTAEVSIWGVGDDFVRRLFCMSLASFLQAPPWRARLPAPSSA